MDTDIKAVEDYIIAYHIVYKLIIKNPISLEETNTLKRILGQYILCQVCKKLPDGLNSQFDVFICTECVNNHETIFKKYFKTLYEIIGTSQLYDDICDNDEYRRMYDKLVTEASGISHQINNYVLQFPLHSQESTEVILGQTKKHMQAKNEEKHKKKKGSSIEQENLNGKLNPEQEHSEDSEQGLSNEQNNSLNQEKICDIIGIAVPNLSVNDEIQYTQKLCSHSNRGSHLYSENIEKVNEINNMDTVVSKLRTKKHMLASNEEKHKKKKGSSIEQVNLNSKFNPEQDNSQDPEQGFSIEQKNLNCEDKSDQKISEDPEQGSSIEQENLNDKLNPEQDNSEDSELGSSIKKGNLNDKLNPGQENSEDPVLRSSIEQENLNDKFNPEQENSEDSEQGWSIEKQYLNDIFNPVQGNLEDPKQALSMEQENLNSELNTGQKILEDPEQGSSIEQENLNCKLNPIQENSENLEKSIDIKDLDTAVSNPCVNDTLINTRKLRSRSNRRSNLNSENVEKVGEKKNLGIAVSNLCTKKHMQASNEEKYKKKKGSSIVQENFISKPNHEEKNSGDPDQGLSIEQKLLNCKLNPIKENSENLEKIIEIKDLDTAVSNPCVNDTLINTRKLRSHLNQKSNLNSENVEKIGEKKNLGTAVSKLRTKKHMQASNEKKYKQKNGSLIEQENFISKPNHEEKNSADPEQELSIEQEYLNDKLNPEQKNSENPEKIFEIKDPDTAVSNLSVNDTLINTRKLRSRSNRRSNLNSKNVEKFGEKKNLGTAVSNLRTNKEILQATDETKQKKEKGSSPEQENLNGALHGNSEDPEQGSSIDQEIFIVKFNAIQETSEEYLEKNIEIKDLDTAVSNPSVNDKLINTRKLRSRSNQRSNLNSENEEKVGEIKNLGTAVSNLRTKKHMKASNEEKYKKKNGSSIEQENFISKHNHEEKNSGDPEQRLSIEQGNSNIEHNSDQKISEDPEQGSSIEQKLLNCKLNPIKENSENLEKIIKIKDLDTAVSNPFVNDTLINSLKLRSHSNRRSNLNSEDLEKVGKIKNLGTPVSNLRTNKEILQANDETKYKKEKRSSPEQEIFNCKFNPIQENSEENLEKIIEIMDLDTSVNDTLINTRKLRSRSNQISNLNSENEEKVVKINNFNTAVSNLCTRKEILQAKKETKRKNEKGSSLERENLNGKLNQKQENSEDLRNVSAIKDRSITVSNLGVNNTLKNTRKLRSRSKLGSNLNSNDLEKSAE